MESLRNAGEIAVGVVFAVGALFNSLYTLSHGEEFYGGFARGAWFGPGRWVVDNVVLPHAAVFTVALILFQVAVAVTILTRGDLVRVGLLSGGVFAILASLVSSPGGTAGNLVAGAIQLALALARRRPGTEHHVTVAGLPPPSSRLCPNRPGVP